MNIKLKLTEKGFVENVDYSFDGVTLLALPKTRMIDVVTTPAVLDANGVEISPAIITPTAEIYYATLPDLNSLKLECSDVAILVSEYLKNPLFVRDMENDTIHISNNQIHEWNFKNVPQPTVAELVALIPAIDKTKQIQDMKIKGAAARVACNHVLDLVGGYNYSRSLTAAQVTEMATLFAPISQCLLLSRPTAAKELITAIVPDGILITAQMQSDILAELAGF